MSLESMNAIQWFTELLRDNEMIEVRQHTSRGWFRGYFDNLDAIMALPGIYPLDNLYTTLNTFGGKTVNNQLASVSAQSVTNDDITSIRRIFFDFDPVRPTDTPSTDAQLKMAYERAMDLRAVLGARGWPNPAVAMSGNGVHLMYRCLLRKDIPTLMPYMKRLYRAMSLKYSDDAVKFDTSVYNAGRITRLYGSVNHKGIPTPEQPHRVSSIRVPARFDNVSKACIWALMREMEAHEKSQSPTTSTSKATRPCGSGDYRTLEVEPWLKSCGVFKGRTYTGGLALSCPWAADHTGGGRQDNFADAVIFENPKGEYPGFHCFHDHCEGRDFFGVVEALGGSDTYCADTYRGASSG